MSRKDKTKMKDTAGGPDGRKYKRIIAGIIAAAVFLIALVTRIGIYNTPAGRLARQIDLGRKYLEKENYEQAVIEFDKAIAIDPMSVDAYLGKADAYIAMGDVNMALQTLEEGYSRTGSESIKKRIEEISLQTAGEAELSRGRRKRMQKRLLISLILCLNCRILRSWDTICLRRITRKSVRHTDVPLIRIPAVAEI